MNRPANGSGQAGVASVNGVAYKESIANAAV